MILLDDYFIFFLSIKIYCQFKPHDSYKMNSYKKVCIMNLIFYYYYIFKQKTQKKQEKQKYSFSLVRSLTLLMSFIEDFTERVTLLII